MPRFRCRLSGLDTSAAVRLRSPSRSPPDAIMRAFSSSLTTTVFSQRSMRWLDASPRRATPKGHQSFISRTAPQSVTRYPSDLLRSWHTPLAQSHLMDADVAGDLSNRTAAVDDESYRLLLVLRRKCAACRTHISLSRKIRAAKPGVHRSGNGSIYPSTGGRPKARRMLTETTDLQDQLAGIFQLAD